jgi:catechol 2,3-dioxygenase-like lactoylglutathione lyase family enzyme
MKLGHIGLPVKDIQIAKTFYDGIASYIGVHCIDAHDDFVGYGSNDSYEFYIHTGRSAISGIHICFEAENKEQVKAFYDSGLSAGGIDNGAPGIRKNYDPTYYAAFLLDPDGNNIEVVFFEK